MKPWRFLVFGATGAIGSEVLTRAIARGWDVVAVSRGSPPADPGDVTWLRYDPLEDLAGGALDGATPFDGVCWAQGANLGDSVGDFDVGLHLDLYRANCLSIMIAMQALLARNLLSASGARLTLVSSIWQEQSRSNKLSYTVTKAAVGGLVRSAAIDLGAEGHLVNGVLPGVLETPMTASNMTPEQIASVRAKTSANKLADLGTVAETILFLSSEQNSSINGQSLTIDLGMTNACLF